MRVQSLGVRSFICLLGLLNTACVHSYCQAVSEQTHTETNASSTVPLSHLYWHFLMYQHQLDEEAAKNEKQGQSGAAVRSVLQAKLNMSDDQFASVHKASDRLSASMSSWNSRVVQLRSLYLQSKPMKDVPLTLEQEQLHDQLKKMNDEREEILTEQMNTLDNELSADDRTRFKDFLTKQFAAHVVVTGSLRNQSPNAATTVGGGAK